MKNPFEYGGVVSGNAFCDREKEVADLLGAIENNEKLFVFSERRYGKTSLVRTALGKLPKKGCVYSYVDLWPTDSEARFVTAVAKAIAESTSTSVDKVLVTAKRFFGSLAPSVTIDEEGLLRKANHLARGALIAAANEKCQQVSADHVRLAATELI